MRKTCLFSFVGATLFCLAVISCSSPGDIRIPEFSVTKKIYWVAFFAADNCMIRSLDLTDPLAIPQDVLSLNYWVYDLEIDSVNGKMYWIDDTSKRIMRANLDGQVIETVVDTSADYNPWDLCLDWARGTLYWTNHENLSIMRSDLDGSNTGMLVKPTIVPNCMALDIRSKRLYWTDTGSGIVSADFNGGDVRTVASDDDAKKISFLSTPVDGRMICTANMGTGQILNVNLSNGASSNVYATGNVILGWALAVDEVNRKAYFHDTPNDNDLVQMDLDGSAVVLDFINEPALGIRGIAFEYE